MEFVGLIGPLDVGDWRAEGGLQPSLPERTNIVKMPEASGRVR
jgi:hypothetical protein